MHWIAILVVAACIAVLPFVIVSILSALREQDMPITAATVTTGVVLSSMIAILSAARIPMSYLGLLFCAPVLLVAMTLATLRMQRGFLGRTAVLEFAGAAAVKRELGKSCSIIHLSDAPNWDFDRVLIDVPSHHTPEWSGILIKCYARK
ncbi:MAG: sugar transferase, partial [Devosia sp.]